MPVRPLLALLVLAAALLPACSSGAAPRLAGRDPAPAVDPPSGPSAARAGSDADDRAARPHEVSLVVDLGPLPDGSGDAVVEATWTTAADGTVRFAIETPAGVAEQHVFTDDEHWWWLAPEVRRTIADAEWVHFDLRAIARVGGELPDLVAEARQPPPSPAGTSVGQVVAGREVLAVDPVHADEAHLTVVGIDQPVVLRRRPLPAGTTVDIPTGAVDVTDLGDVLRW